MEYKKQTLLSNRARDGSYLTELLLEKGYEVHGIIRKASTFNTSRIDHLYKDPHNKNLSPDKSVRRAREINKYDSNGL